jgi:hypothetical protein
MAAFGFGVTRAARRLRGGALVTSGDIAPYLGQVATRSLVNAAQSSSSAIMSRTAHVATQDITVLQLLFCNWYLSQAATESANAASVTYAVSIEYPAGTVAQVTWAGATSKTAASLGDTGLSDPASVTIPSGAVFWVRCYATSTAATIPVTGVGERWSAQGEASVVSGATDQTMSGTVTDGGSYQFLHPTVIVANTTKPSFAIHGDSRAQYQSTVMDAATGAVGQIAESLGSSYPWSNFAQSSNRMYNQNKNGARIAALAKYFSHIICNLGVNDTLDARTLAQMQGDVEIFRYRFRNKTIIWPTIECRTTSTDSWATVANQTLDANDPTRVAFNAWLKTIPTRISAAPDIAADISDASTGKWKAPGYTDDGLHPSSTAGDAIKAGGKINGATLGALPNTAEFSPLQVSTTVLFHDLNNPAITPGTATTLGTIASPEQLSSGTGTYSATGFQGAKPGMSFTTGQYILGDTNYNNLTNGKAAVTLAAVGQLSGYVGGWIYTINNNGSSVSRAALYCDATGHLGLGYKRLDAEALTNVYSTAVTATGVPVLIVGVFDPTNNSARLYVNGVQVTSGTFITTGAFSATTSQASGAGRGLTFNQAAAFDSALSDGDRQKIEGFMAWKAGVAATVLPAGHPYRSAPPAS